MTDLWYLKCNDFLRLETLKRPEIHEKLVLKFHYFLLEPLLASLICCAIVGQ